MHNPESAPENETHKDLWDFEIQTDHLISARRPDLVRIEKKKKKEKRKKKRKKDRPCRIVDFAVRAHHRLRIKENEKRDKYFDLAREQKARKGIMKYATNCGWCTWDNLQRIGKGIGRFGHKRTSRDHQDYSIKTSQNTEKSRRLKETYYHSNSNGKPSANAGVKNLHMS